MPRGQSPFIMQRLMPVETNQQQRLDCREKETCYWDKICH